MQRRERNPETALREGTICKLKNRMHHLLEPLQCWMLLHFAAAESDPASAGDGLTVFASLGIDALMRSADTEGGPVSL
jgi:hypothetical protein